MNIRIIRQFLATETAGGLILLISALIAITWANSPLAHFHQTFIANSLFWVNDVLMTFFFLLVGLELKRGFLEQHFSSANKIRLPLMAALGGMVLPALIYIAFNVGNSITLKGWATPVATDIAFAIAALSLLGSRIPLSLKLFLLALAIFDDIGAIIIIAFFYAHEIAYEPLFFSLLVFLSLIYLNLKNINALWLYWLCGLLLWIGLFRGGVHPTLAGVVMAIFMPKEQISHIMEKLHPWVAYLIMPLFAFVNAGVSFAAITQETLFDTVVLGIVFGLFLGKPLGVLSFSWLSIKLKIASLPEDITWGLLAGVAILCGIGFTMSLFLGTLSFQNLGLHQNQALYLAEVRLGVMIGSVLSGFLGTLLLYFVIRNRSMIVAK